MTTKKKVLIIVAAILVAIILLIVSINIIFGISAKDKQYGVAMGYDWTQESTYNEDIHTQSLEMGSGEFKILILTDIHLDNHGTFANELGINYILDGVSDIALKKLVKKADPNFIVVLGDTVCTERNDINTKRFVKFMDKFKLPWACVFGNHDDEGRADKAKLVDELLKSEYGLFQYGAKDLHGAGNYTIRLTREDKTQYNLFMFDSGSSSPSEIDKQGINAKQVSWYNWINENTKDAEGIIPKNMVFAHIPIPEYANLDTYLIGDRLEEGGFGIDDGKLFDAMKVSNGTHMMVGHDHNNNFIAEKDGIKLGYAMKSSYNCYFKSKMTGGTLFTINNQNQVKEELIHF